MPPAPRLRDAGRRTILDGMRDRAFPFLPGVAARLGRAALVVLLLLGLLGTGQTAPFAAPQSAHLLDHGPAAKALPVQAALLRAAEKAAPEPQPAPAVPSRAAAAADFAIGPARRASAGEAARGPFRRTGPRPASQGPPQTA